MPDTLSYYYRSLNIEEKGKESAARRAAVETVYLVDPGAAPKLTDEGLWSSDSQRVPDSLGAAEERLKSLGFEKQTDGYCGQLSTQIWRFFPFRRSAARRQNRGSCLQVRSREWKAD